MANDKTERRTADLPKPECRYGHGALLRARKESEQWRLMDETHTFSFGLALFVCRTCGYAEIFDPEPALTVAAETGEG